MVAMSFVACAEEDLSSPQPEVQSVLIEASDGTTFVVRAENNLNWSHEEVMSYLSNITIEPIDPSLTPSRTDDGTFSRVPPMSPTVEKLARDGGFVIDVETLDPLDAVRQWRWNFSDLGHAQGFCPGM